MTAYVCDAATSPPAPSFAVTITPSADDASDCDIEIDTASNGGFTTDLDTTTLLAQASDVAVAITVGPFLPGATIYVRARCGAGGSWSSYTDTIEVEIPATAGDTSMYIYENIGVLLTLSGDATEYIYENIGVRLVKSGDGTTYLYEGDVNADDPTPRIWCTVPSSGRPGDGLTVIGFGFGPTQETYDAIMEMFLDPTWEAIPIISWAAPAAGPNAYNEYRAIQPFDHHITVEHQEIEVTIHPDALPPGAPIRGRIEV